MYRLHPQTKKIIELIQNKAIGETKLIQATFSFQADYDARSILFSKELGGGGILDVGGYCTSMARRVSSCSARSRPTTVW